MQFWTVYVKILWGEFMVNKLIIDKLLPKTEEEERILNGSSSVDWQIYNEQGKESVNAKKLLKSGKLFTIRAHTRFVHFREHTHDYVEMIYMCSGTTKHKINGIDLTLKEGELLFLSQNATQEIFPAGEKDIAINFIILPKFFDNSLTLLGADRSPLSEFLIGCLQSGDSYGGYLHFKVSDILPIQNLIENLLWTLLYDSTNKRYIDNATLSLLFSQLLSYTDRLSYTDADDEDTVRLFRYIDGNYKTATLTGAAELLSYDIFHLSRIIKKKTGKTFTQLLQEKRLSRATYLLKNTERNIDEISVSVGYENISYFHRIFKKRYNMSPRDYRFANKDTFLIK